MYIKLRKNPLRPGGKICYILIANTRLSPEILVNCRKLVTILSERAKKWVKSIGVTLFGLLLLKRDTQLGWGRQKLTPQSRKKCENFVTRKRPKFCEYIFNEKSRDFYRRKFYLIRISTRKYCFRLFFKLAVTNKLV